MPNSGPASARRSSAGFSLIEVLISLLVLLVGLLGVVGMQLFSVQTNQGAALRTQATFIASDTLDRIRGNKAGQDADAYDGFDTNDGIPGDAAGTCATSSAGCNAAQLANLDLRAITAHVADVYGVSGYRPTLPSGRVEVDKIPIAGTTTVEYVVRVSWNERDWESGAGGEVERVDDVERFVELRSVIRDK